MRKLSLAAAICGALFVSLTATAQMSDADLEEAITAMRNAGIAESQIEKFRSDVEAANAKMRAFNANPPPEIPDLKSGDALLQEQRATFQATYGTAPDATIDFRDETYVLKVTTCDRGEGWFVIEAKTQPGPGSSIFGAVLNTNPDGSSYATIDFQSGDVRAGTTTAALALDGSRFSYQGLVDVSDSSDSAQLQVNLNCDL